MREADNALVVAVRDFAALPVNRSPERVAARPRNSCNTHAPAPVAVAVDPECRFQYDGLTLVSNLVAGRPVLQRNCDRQFAVRREGLYGFLRGGGLHAAKEKSCTEET